MAALVRAEKVQVSESEVTWTVVGPDHLPISDVDSWLAVLRAQNMSAKTIEAYARHLSLFLRWLHLRGSGWESLTLHELSLFLGDLHDGVIPLANGRAASPRMPSSSKAVLAAVTNFLEFWRIEGKGPSDLRLYREMALSSRRSDRFLAHVESKRGQSRHRLRIKGGDARPPIQTIEFERDFASLLDAANTWRDRLLLSCMYDGALRIGQAVGLRHEDLDMVTKSASVVRRTDNVNGALSKQRQTFKVLLPKRTFDLYAKYLIEEQLAAGVESDYVFTNLRPPVGSPLKPETARDVVKAIGRRAGVTLTPHTLRHTHATALAKEGWTAPEIAARLGQSSSASADPYIHLASSDIAAKFDQTNRTMWNRETS